MFPPLPFSCGPSRAVRAALCVLAAAAVCALGAGNARAQTQERGLLDRIDHPDRTLAFSPAQKQFSANAAFKNKEASVKTFGFGKSAAVAGDGVFRTRSFSSAAFKAKDYNVRNGAATGQKSFGQTNKLFDTQSVDVRDDRQANKTVSVGAYGTRDPFVVHGKRQDTYDEMLKRNKLSIQEVRELLNKNQ